jgi:hypothetical protein
MVPAARKPPKPPQDDAAPKPVPPSTYYGWQQQLTDDKPNTVHDLPKQPAGSPWAGDPVPAEEPIDRREDSDVMGVPIDQLP